MVVNNRIGAGLVLAAFIVGNGRAAWAAIDDSSAEAVRTISNQAAKDYEEGRFAQALDKFERAYATAKVPRLAVWLARTHAKLGHLVTANSLYRQAVNLEKTELWVGKFQEQAQADARQELATLQPRIPKVTIRIEGADAKLVSVRIDGVEVPPSLLAVERLIDPGEHVVVGKLGNEEPQQKVKLAEGERQEVVLKFASDGSSPPGQITPNQPNPKGTEGNGSSTSDQPQPHSAWKKQKTWGWVGIGVGAAGIVVGAASGIMVASKYGDLKQQCPERNCGPNDWSNVDSYQRLRMISLVGFVVGGVGVATGVTLLLTSPREDSERKLGMWFGPASAGIRGDF
jgi:hypothetical protein